MPRKAASESMKRLIKENRRSLQLQQHEFGSLFSVYSHDFRLNSNNTGMPGKKSGSSITVPSPELKAFNTFLERLPPVLNQWGLEKVFAGMKKNEKETLAIVDRLLRCLFSYKSSTSRACNAYVTLVILLTSNTHVKSERVIELINEIFVTDGDQTRGERRSAYAGKVLGFGALVRSGRLQALDSKTVNMIIGQLVSLAVKRTSLLTIAAPFLCYIFSDVLKDKHVKKLDLAAVQELLNVDAKPHLAPVFKLSLAISHKQVPLQFPLLSSIDTICEAVSGSVRHDDITCFHLLFRYLVQHKETKQFWKVFMTKLGPYHFDLLQSTILIGLEAGCPLKHILKKGVLTPLVTLFRSGGRHEDEMTKQVVTIFRHLLNWEKDVVLSSTARLAAIRLLFGELEISSEYRLLHAILRRFLTFLTKDELKLVATLCQNQSGLESRGGNSTISFLSNIPANKKTPLETKLSIALELFRNAFCHQSSNLPKVLPEVVSMRERLSREAFVSVLKHTYDTDFIHKLFSHVNKVATGKDEEGLTLKVRLPEENLSHFKIIKKLRKKVGDTDLSNCLEIYGIYSVVDAGFAIDGLTSLVRLCERTMSVGRTARALEIIGFILTAIRTVCVIFDYTAIFTKLLIEKSVHADAVQLLVKIIDVDMAHAVDDDEYDTSDVDEDVPEPEVERMNGVELSPRINKKEREPESDEESLDMDDVSAAELEKMDNALASAVSTKFRLKDVYRREETLIVRVLNLLRLLFRRYSSPDDGAIPLLVLIPALTLLCKSGKGKKQDIHARTTDVVRRLNSIRHIGNASSFDPSIIRSAKEDVVAMLGKKLPKNVRQLINGSLEMLERCFHAQLKVKEVKKRKKVPVTGGVAKRRRTLSN